MNSEAILLNKEITSLLNESLFFILSPLFYLLVSLILVFLYSFTMEYISFIAIIARNTPKHFFKIFLEIFEYSFDKCTYLIYNYFCQYDMRY